MSRHYSILLLFLLFSFCTNTFGNTTEVLNSSPAMCAFTLGPIAMTESSGTPNDNAFCHNSYANINATFLVPGQVASWQWSSDKPNNIIINNGTSAYASLYLTNESSTAVAAILTLTATDLDGCTQSQSVNLLISPKLTVNVTERDNSGSPNDKGICFGDETEFSAHARGGIPPFQYDWSHLPVTSDSIITFQPPWDNQIHVYYLDVSDSKGCTASTFESAKGFTEISGDATGVLDCAGDQIVLNVRGGVPSPAGYVFLALPDSASLAVAHSPFTLPIQQANGTTKSYTTFAKDEKGCGINLTTIITTDADMDGDGHRADCDCDDNNPSIFQNCGPNSSVLTLTCPNNQTVTAAQGTTSAPITYNAPQASSTCTTGSVILSRTSGLASGQNFPVGTNTVQYRAQDGCNLTKTCAFTVTVNAPTPTPVLTLTCPNNQTVTAAQGMTGAPITYNAPQASSTCTTGSVILSRTSGLASGQNFPVGTNTVQYRAQDGCNLTKTCAFTVTVNAPTPTPVLTLTCPNNQTVTAAQGMTGVTVSYLTPQASSTCTIGAVVLSRLTGLASGTTFPIGTTTVRYSALDGCNLAKTCAFNVTVNAPTPTPVLTLTCPNNQTVTAAQGTTSAPITYNAPQASSTCTTSSVVLSRTSGLASGQNFPVGTNTVQYRAQDGCNLTKTCAFTVTVNAPVSNSGCTGNLILNGDFETNTAWNGLIRTSQESHGGTNAAQICATGFNRIYQNVNITPGVDYTFSFWSKRATAHSDAVSIKYFSTSWAVLDNSYITIPTETVWTLQSMTTQAPAGSSFVEISLVKNGGTDCIYFDDVCFAPSTNTGQITLTCPQNITQTAALGATSMSVTYLNPTGTTTCATNGLQIQRSAGLASSAQFPIGVNTVTYAASDACGNTTTCSFNININSANAGQISINCPSNINQTIATGINSTPVTYPLPTGSTTCPSNGFSLQRTVGLASGANFPVGTSTVTYSASDACSNIKSCSFTINLTATTPNTGCANNLVVNSDFENNVSWVGLTRTTSEQHGGTQAAQLCGPALARVYQYLPVTPGQDYTLKVWAKNNATGSDALVVKYFSSSWTILDNIFQSIQTTNNWQEFTLNSTAPAGTAFVEINLFHTGQGCVYIDDVCFTSGSAPNNGTLSLTCPSNQTVTTTPNLSTIVANYNTPQVSTTCTTAGATTVRQSGLASGANFPIGTNTVTYSATDNCGNAKTCAFTITVQAGSTSTSPCDALVINSNSNSITVAGLPSTKAVIIQLLQLPSYTKVEECFNSCDKPVNTFVNLSPGTYQVKIDLYDIDFGWKYLCQRIETVQVTSNLIVESAFSLDVKQLGLQSQLIWTCSATGGNQAFYMERSEDETHFETIQSYSLTAEKDEILYFNEFDKQPIAGKNYYRIRSVSEDGQETYSPVQQTYFEKNSDFSVYPNPTNGILQLERANKDTDASVDVKILNTASQIVAQQQIQPGQQISIFDLSGLPAGIYFIQYLTETNRPITQRVVLTEK